MPWAEWIRTVEVEPSLYAADFSRLGEQIEQLLGAGVRVFHYDVGDGHFVEPIIIGPVVLQSISGLIHEPGGRVDVHLMVESPERHFRAFREAGADSVTFHYEAVEEVAEAAIDAGVDLVLCMSIEPGYSGQPFMPEAYERLRRLRELLPGTVQLQVDGGVNGDNIGEARQAGANLFVAATAVFGEGDPAVSYRRLVDRAG